MNYELLFEIINELVNINPNIVRILSEYIDCHLEASTPKEKDKYEKYIKDHLYGILMRFIDIKSKKELYNCKTQIQDDSYHIKLKYPDWHINRSGATKIVKIYDILTITDELFREYNKGFYYVTDNPTREEIDFLQKNHERLSRISNNLDTIDEIISYRYKTEKNISRDLTDKIIKFIGLYRIPEEKYNKNTHSK